MEKLFRAVGLIIIGYVCHSLADTNSHEPYSCEVAEKLIKTKKFSPSEGMTCVDGLDKNFIGIVDSIEFVINDAFDGSTAHSPADELIFRWGNKLHIETKKSTLKKRILFKKGDKITRDLLLETERVLRSEEFLADALIEIKNLEGDKKLVVIHTFDQWTTLIPTGLQILGGRWVYWVGLLEVNLLGTGQQLGVFYSHGLDRDTYSGIYENKAFLFNNLQLGARLGKSTDGQEYEFKLTKPLLSKSQKWGFEMKTTGLEQTKYFYSDADNLELVRGYLGEIGVTDDSTVSGIMANLKTDNANTLFKYDNVNDLKFLTHIDRSFGLKHKFLLRGTFSYTERFQKDPDPSINSTIPTSLELDTKKNMLVGAYLEYSQVDYKTVTNFRNLKWSENVNVGFNFASGIYQNQKVFGASNSDFFFAHKLSYNNIWNSRHFIETNLNSDYFLDSKGNFEDGTLSHIMEYQWKPITLTSTYFGYGWKNFFATQKSAQLLLGEETGLNGYPNRVFTGQARFLMVLEQRLFPAFELVTAVPALAVFLNAGNTFPTYRHFEWDELHYSVGFGLRTGFSRSTQKVVNHFNISMPIESKYRGDFGWKFWQPFTFSIKAKLNL